MTKSQMLSALRDAGVRAEWYGPDGTDYRGAAGPPDPASDRVLIVCSASGWPVPPDEVSFKVILEQGRWYLETWSPYRYLIHQPRAVPAIAATLFGGAIPAGPAPARLPEPFCVAHGLLEIAPSG